LSRVRFRYLQIRRSAATRVPGESAPKADWRAFVQILGKFNFVELIENLRRILFDYGQKRSGIANAAFKAAC
jgi:hypothetical protein